MNNPKEPNYQLLMEFSRRMTRRNNIAWLKKELENNSKLLKAPPEKSIEAKDDAEDLLIGNKNVDDIEKKSVTHCQEELQSTPNSELIETQQLFDIIKRRLDTFGTLLPSYLHTDPSINHLPKYIDAIMQSSHESVQSEALSALRTFLWQKTVSASQLMKFGVVPTIIQFLNKKSDQHESKKRIECRLEAALIIANIAICSSESLLCVIQHGAIEALVELLRNEPDSMTAIQAISGLRNITRGLLSDSRSHIMYINVTNSFRISQIKYIVVGITKLMAKTENERVIADCLRTLYDICCEHLLAYTYLYQNDAVTICVNLLHQEIGKYKKALNQLQDKHECSDKQMRKITKEAMLKMNRNIYIPALRITGSFLTDDESELQMVLDAGFLDVIEPFMLHSCEIVRRETYWYLSNIMTGTRLQIQSVLSRSVLMERIVKATTHEIMNVRKQACWCIINATTQECDTSIAQKKQLAQYGAIEALCSMLVPRNPLLNTFEITFILAGLEAFLDIFGTASYNPYAQKIEECVEIVRNRSGDKQIREILEMPQLKNGIRYLLESRKLND